MKKLLIAAALLGASSMAQADLDILEYCTAQGGFAERAIKSSQYQTESLTESLQRWKDTNSNSDDVEFFKWGNEVILNAYMKPVYNSSKMRKKVIAEYRDEVTMNCLKSLNY